MWRAVSLAHGSGGKETSEIVDKLIISKLRAELMRVEGGLGTDVMDDGAAIPMEGGGYLIVTVDSYTVNPPRFPGGDIGALAASGTINDVLMMGGRPIAMLDSVVVEEGFPIDELNSLLDSMLGVLASEGVALIGGDFKVMPRGQVDGIVITAVGLGIARRPIVDSGLRPGDRIIVTDYVGEHGATIMALQHGIDLSRGELRSDVKPLTKLMLPLLEEFRDAIHAARDPTRGGLAMALNDWAVKSGVSIVVDEESIPLREPVRAYSEVLGIDPLTLASEGVALLGVERSKAEEVLERVHELGYKNAAIIGEAVKPGRLGSVVLLRTSVGGTRVVEPPTGEIVPRIC